MLTWIILLVFGVPLVAFIMQSMRINRNCQDRLQEISERLAQKRQDAIDAKVAEIKSKRDKSIRRD
ncbi:hypothetical protein [Teredinibacter sp. KSP-S5-2]|uniref:hypothetical protein n=1 Tax=Teredinibacter sp. KSP-S5-2 TaxID=3034506 RepID=UPI00293529EB|nr:hypothetical protein [Teredinibacter sp. KSP-S5-2]WNO09021.1 hypothetical protein P5V12_18930 [Teredinibacter sp. KSP-S5-2]